MTHENVFFQNNVDYCNDLENQGECWVPVEIVKQWNESLDKLYYGWAGDPESNIKVVNTGDVWIDLYTEELKQKPNDTEILYKRGKMYEVVGKQDEALADYSRIIELSPDHADAYLKRSQCYLRKGLKDEAISDFNNVIRLKPHQYGSGVSYGFITKTVAVDVFVPPKLKCEDD